MAYYGQADERDWEIINDRMAAFDENKGLRVGDWVDFADGSQRRISYIWEDEAGRPEGIQTSSPGSGFHLYRGAVSMGNGSLYTSVPASSMTLTDEIRKAYVWIFHHEQVEAHNSVTVAVGFRVYRCYMDAPKC